MGALNVQELFYYIEPDGAGCCDETQFEGTIYGLRCERVLNGPPFYLYFVSRAPL